METEMTTSRDQALQEIVAEMDALVPLPSTVADWKRRISDVISRPANPPSEAVAWKHVITEPNGAEQVLYSALEENPWSHWQKSYGSQCRYSAIPLYPHPPADAGVVTEARLAAASLAIEDVYQTLTGNLMAEGAAEKFAQAALSAKD